MDRWFGIFNPASRGGKSRRKFPEILRALRLEGMHVHAALTAYRGHGTEITRQALKDGYRLFLCVGGDGTMNEVINGIFSQEEVPPRECGVSMLAVGMGKDWIRTVGIPPETDAAIRAVKQGKILWQDVGKVTYFAGRNKQHRFFANVAGIGYDAFVTDIVNAMKEKGRSGTLPYLMALLTCLAKYRHRRVRLTVDSLRTEADVFSMNVGICRYSGGGMKQVPHAVPDDGLFDVTFIKNVTKLDVLKNVKRLYDGSFIQHPKIETFRGKEITIHARPSIALEIDGENVGHSPFHFTILPKSLRVVGVP